MKIYTFPLKILIFPMKASVLKNLTLFLMLDYRHLLSFTPSLIPSAPNLGKLRKPTYSFLWHQWDDSNHAGTLILTPPPNCHKDSRTLFSAL